MQGSQTLRINQAKMCIRDRNPTFLYLLEEPFTVYEATELVNLINPGRPIVSNNFLVKFGEFVEEVGVKRVPKKKPRKTYRLKQ